MDTLLRRRQMMVMDTAPLPTFHTRLVFDGTAYIDTDIIIPENGTVRFDGGYEAEKKSQTLFNVGGKLYGILNSSTNNTSRFFTANYYGSSAVSGTSLGVAWTYNTYGFWLTPKRVGIGDRAFTFTKGSTLPEGGLVVGMNAAHTGVAYTGRLKMIRIYGSDAQNCESTTDLNSYTPVYTLKPCTYNGENGLWCVETDSFYGNTAGAGQLSVVD